MQHTTNTTRVVAIENKNITKQKMNSILFFGSNWNRRRSVCNATYNIHSHVFFKFYSFYIHTRPHRLISSARSHTDTQTIYYTMRLHFIIYSCVYKAWCKPIGFFFQPLAASAGFVAINKHTLTYTRRKNCVIQKLKSFIFSWQGITLWDKSRYVWYGFEYEIFDCPNCPYGALGQIIWANNPNFYRFTKEIKFIFG